MIYLKDFKIPKDDLVNVYFSGRIYGVEIPYNMPFVCKNTHLNTWYPWNTLYNRGLNDFSFEDITILYGGNGSGKTTLLNIIAQKLKLKRSTRYNKSTCFNDYISICEYNATDLNAEHCIERGCILVSDDVFDAMLKNREENECIDQRREELVNEYFTAVMPQDLSTPENINEFLRLHSMKKKSCSKYVKASLKRNYKEQSNGETAFEYFVQTVEDDSLILLDEPENSLSAKWQMELRKFIEGAVRAFRCQFIIATHSPFLLSIPGAKIYNLDSLPIRTDKWYNLENVRSYYQLFKENERFFQ